MALNQRKKIRALRTSPTYASGVTLVEVLVAVVVLSVGLLGIAGLQVGVAKYKINTNARSSISSLYADIADRIRINPDVAGTNLFTGVESTSEYLLNSTWATQQSDALTNPTLNCLTAVCTTTQRATYDMVVWRQRVRSSLPQGAALITGNLATGISLTMMWYDKEFTDKRRTTDDGTSDTAVSLVNATCVGNEAGLARQSCCPAAASVPNGVRCARFFFTP